MTEIIRNKIQIYVLQRTDHDSWPPKLIRFYCSMTAGAGPVGVRRARPYPSSKENIHIPYYKWMFSHFAPALKNFLPVPHPYFCIHLFFSWYGILETIMCWTWYKSRRQTRTICNRRFGSKRCLFLSGLFNSCILNENLFIYLRLMINITFHVLFYSILNLVLLMVLWNHLINIYIIRKMFIFQKMVEALVCYSLHT